MNLGEAYVTIEARMSKLEKDLSRVRLLTKKSADAAEGSWKKSAAAMESHFSGAISRMGRRLAGFAGAYIGARSVFNFFKSSIAEAKEAYQIEKELNYTLRERGVFTQRVVRDYERIANLVQRTTNYTDDQAKSVEKVLTLAGVRPRMMQNAVAAVMNLSAVRGGNPEEIAQLLLRARANPDNLALRGIPKGMGFEGIINWINRQYGGQAQQAQTPWARASNAWNQFKESVGTQILPRLIPILDKFVNWLNSPGGQALAINIGKLAESFINKGIDKLNKMADAVKTADVLKDLFMGEPGVPGFVDKALNIISGGGGGLIDERKLDKYSRKQLKDQFVTSKSVKELHQFFYDVNEKGKGKPPSWVFF